MPTAVRRVALVGLALALVLTALVVERLWSRPLDLNDRWGVLAWIDDLAERDRVAYPAHITFGTLLNHLGGNPTAAAAQWVKAAAHARSEDEVQRVSRGLAVARERGAGEFDAILCDVGTRSAPAVRSAINRAGASCPGFDPGGT